MFWDNYLNLCRSVGKAPTVAAVEMGFSDAAPTGWKNGVIPRQSSLKRIADYFGVTVACLLQDNKKPAPTNEDGTDEAILRFLHSLPIDKLRGILTLVDAPKELIAALNLEERKE